MSHAEADAAQQEQFAKAVSEAINSLTLTDDRRRELKEMAEALGGKVEEETAEDGTTRQCYWLCETSNHACNPSTPIPHCRCVRKCF